MTNAPEPNPRPDPSPAGANVKGAEAIAPSRTAEGHDDATCSASAETIPKPDGGFNLNPFKSKRADAIANVDTLQTGLPVMTISQAKDFVRLHPDEEAYWSPELCFVEVPIKGAERFSLHLIEEDLAMGSLPSGKILRFRLALATKPYDVFFLCRIPTQNLDNKWNHDNIIGIEQAKKLWTQATSRRKEGIEGYLIEPARDPDAFPKPKWLQQPLLDLIERTFADRAIIDEEHPG
jgi:hypothetical protein